MDQKTLERALALYRAGQTYAEIGRAIHYSPTQVGLCIRQSIPPDEWRSAINRRKREEALRLRIEEHYTYPEIAVALNFPSPKAAQEAVEPNLPPREPKVRSGRKRCPGCRKWRILQSEFTKDRRSADGLAYRCKYCKREEKRFYRQTNWEAVRAVERRSERMQQAREERGEHC